MKINNRQLYASKYEHMITALEEGEVPASLLEAKDSLLKRLFKSRNDYLNQFMDDDEYYKMPAMGMIEVAHEICDEATSLFATDLKTKTLTRIRIYGARQSKSSGRVEKDELKTELVMSEKQFGEILLNTNSGIGYPVTMEIINGQQVEKYNQDIDPSKNDMRFLREKMKKPSVQTDRFMREIQEILLDAEEKGKLGKHAASEIIHNLTMIPGYIVSNAAFDVERLSEEMQKRISEASLNLHLNVSHLALKNEE